MGNDVLGKFVGEFKGLFET